MIKLGLVLLVSSKLDLVLPDSSKLDLVLPVSSQIFDTAPNVSVLAAREMMENN